MILKKYVFLKDQVVNNRFRETLQMLERSWFPAGVENQILHFYCTLFNNTVEFFAATTAIKNLLTEILG